MSPSPWIAFGRKFFFGDYLLRESLSIDCIRTADLVSVCQRIRHLRLSSVHILFSRENSVILQENPPHTKKQPFTMQSATSCIARHCFSSCKRQLLALKQHESGRKGCFFLSNRTFYHAN